MVGNEQPLYWRFTSRKNVDGAVREAAGPQLRQACLEFPALAAAVDAMEEEPRDISRWAETAKRGSSTTLRCAPGAAVVTRGFGLDCDWCVHAVAPDSEFGYEGHYQGQPGIRGEEVRARSSPPLRRLRQTYEAALAACHRRGAETAALPALGAGVKGWRPSISAAMCLDALCRDAERGRFAEVSVVLGSDDAWVAFGKAFSALVGDADEERRPRRGARLARRGRGRAAALRRRRRDARPRPDPGARAEARGEHAGLLGGLLEPHE